MSRPYVHKLAIHRTLYCDCGEPSVYQGRPDKNSNTGCARCRRLEGAEQMPETCGFSTRIIRDIPRGSIAAIGIACDKWLKSRGIETATGHTRIEYSA